MRNFKCHEEMDMVFDKNQFITIVGKNGSGKTTVIDAILFGLYDTTTRGSRGVDVVRKRSKRNCSVILEFEIDEDKYRIENYKKHKQHGESKILFKNEENISGATRKDTNILIESIVMPESIFSNCLLFSQFMNKSFTSSSYSNQRDLLDKMLNTECYDELYANTTESLKTIKSKQAEIETNKNVIDVKIREKSEKILDLNKTISTIETNSKNSISLLDSELKEKQSYIKLNSEVLDTHGALKESYNNLNLNISKTEDIISHRREAANSEIEAYKSSKDNEYNEFVLNVNCKYDERVQDCYKKIQNLQGQLTQNEKDKQLKIESETNSLTESLRGKKRKYDDILERSRIIIRDLESSQNELEIDIRIREIELKKISDEIKKQSESLEQETPVCPTCGQNIGDDTKDNLQSVLDDKRHEFSNKSIELESIKVDVEKLKTDISDKSTKLDKFIETNESEIETETNRINTIITNIKTEFANKSSDIQINIEKENNYLKDLANKKTVILENKKAEIVDETNAEIEVITKKHKTIVESDVAELNRLKNSIPELEEKLKGIELRVSQYNSCVDRIKSIDKEIKNITYGCTTNINSIKSQIREVSDNIFEDESNLKTFDLELEELSKDLDIMDFWKKAFSDTGIKSILLDESIPILNSEARRLSQLTNNIRISFDSQKTLKSGDQSNKFSINVTQIENLSGLSELSAGEERMVNIIVLLCLRHLLEKMQNTKLNLLLLDEILDTLDPDNVEIALDMVKNLAKEHTVILISHTLRDSIESDVNYRM